MHQCKVVGEEDWSHHYCLAFFCKSIWASSLTFRIVFCTFVRFPRKCWGSRLRLVRPLRMPASASSSCGSASSPRIQFGVLAVFGGKTVDTGWPYERLKPSSVAKSRNVTWKESETGDRAERRGWLSSNLAQNLLQGGNTRKQLLFSFLLLFCGDRIWI